MAYKIFVDGAVGTTGLRIHQRLSDEADIQLLTLPEAQRKDLAARLAKMAEADLTFLCLPDAAAKEIVQHAPPSVKICDTSTAHRTQPNWVYGFPELVGLSQVAAANRVAVPGCHATGFLALVTPLIQGDILPANYPLVCQSLTGYSGGGKAMIAEYEQENCPESYRAPRLYGLGLTHKHLPEMQKISGLQQPPLFCPVVDDYYSGMLVSVALPMAALKADWQSGEKIAAYLQTVYQNSPLIQVHSYQQAPDDNTLSANALSGKDSLEIFVLGSPTQLLLSARFDNLGKGASGAAIQCMNLMLGRTQTAGLVI
ncbi:N-acetyl-gamma-glutamyl-phosphate reductase [[Haemophilus] felis]|nr:N-acetyl-gamma-glutamyl-phosphate reductase [[Haemophilus] felis]